MNAYIFTRWFSLINVFEDADLRKSSEGRDARKPPQIRVKCNHCLSLS